MLEWKCKAILMVTFQNTKLKRRVAMKKSKDLTRCKGPLGEVGGDGWMMSACRGDGWMMSAW